MSFNFFKKPEKKEKVVEMSLQELLNARDTIVRAGKENAETIVNSKLTPELETLIEERVQLMYDIQEDEEAIKLAILRANNTTNNDINILKYSAKKVIVQTLRKFAKYHKEKNVFLKKIKLNQKIRLLEREMEKLSIKMKNNNEGHKVKVILISGVV